MFVVFSVKNHIYFILLIVIFVAKWFAEHYKRNCIIALQKLAISAKWVLKKFLQQDYYKLKINSKSNKPK